jgi:membrane fusion protein (multidrug efflux system)
MKRSTKIISIIIIFFLIIASVIVARTMIGKHFQKKFGKRPPPGIMVTEVIDKEFSEKIETFGTAVSNKTKSFRIKREDLIGDLKLNNNYVKKGDVIINLKSGNIVAPFSGVLGYTGLTEDIFVSNSTFIITLDDNSIIFSDIKIPENYSAVMKKGLPIEVRVSSYKNKIFNGEVNFVSSRINAETRSLLTRIKINNNNLELISGSLLEVSVKFNLRNSLSIPDTSVMMEGEKAYVYKVSKDNVVNKTEIKVGLRSEGSIEVISGLNIGDVIVAEGLKKVYPRSKIKPIKN